VIATGSLSKAYGLPGLRIGWAVTDPATAERLWARSDYMTIAPAALSDVLARVALDPAVRPRLLARTRAIIDAGLATLEAWLADQRNGDGRPVFSWMTPAAGAILFARYDLPILSATLAERLRAEHGVLVVPGAHFEMEHHLRFGFGIKPTALEQALDRMGALFECLANAAPVGAH
jgi:aspartate/methionine/tyrosine aminotransferase